MTSEDQLIDYIRRTGTRDHVDRPGLEQQIEAIFQELGLAWSKRPDGNWVIQADIGEVLAGLNDTADILSFWQVINQLSGKPKQHADLLWGLLSLNGASNGAYFALHPPDSGGAPLLIIMARLAAERLDAGEVAQTLASLFGLSKACE
ncbi:MAG: YbjN domain-containing protein [Actinomycetota bacterium]|nr:YbjN domain-containing protein [Actinomycetota bacterium]